MRVRTKVSQVQTDVGYLLIEGRIRILKWEGAGYEANGIDETGNQQEAAVQCTFLLPNAKFRENLLWRDESTKNTAMQNLER